MHPTLKFFLQHPLLRGRPWVAVGKFLWWQGMARVSPGRHCCAWIGKSKFWLQRGWGGLTGNYYAGLHEFEDMAFLLHLLRPDDRFVDVGANMGSYTILARSVCHACTVSYEPVPVTFRRLQDNLKLNGALDHRSRLVNAAVGSAPGMLKMSEGEDTTNHIARADDAAALEVAVVTLDQDLFATPLLLKVDVEGFETEVFRGAHRHLANPALRAIIVELNDLGKSYGYDEQALHTKLLAAGFQSFTYDPFTRTLHPLAAPGPQNTIYCRDLAFIKARLQSAPLIEALGMAF